MAAAKDFRCGIAECAKDAIEKHPKNDHERINCFIAMLCGWIRDSEPAAAADLRRVLNPNTPIRDADGA